MDQPKELFVWKADGAGRKRGDKMTIEQVQDPHRGEILSAVLNGKVESGGTYQTADERHFVVEFSAPEATN